MIRNDERDWVAGIIAAHEKPKTMTLYQLARYIAMYYYDQWHDLKNTQYTNNVLEVMRKFNFDFVVFQEWRFVKYIKNFCKKLVDGKVRHELLDIKSVSITKKEIEIVQSAETEKQQQLMFTFFVLAKINLMPTGWVNYDLKDVFECADLKMTKQKRHRFIHDLYVQNLVQLNEYPDKRGYKVELQDDNDVAITVNCFEHLGRQYLDKYKDGWIMCKRCKKMIKQRSPRQMYCSKCAKEIEQENHKMRNRNYYKQQISDDFENVIQPA